MTLDVCFLNEETESFQIGNTASSVKRLMKQIMKKNPNTNVHLCIENTGKYSWRLMEIIPEYDVKFYIVNPLHLKRSLGLIRGKNDKIDAIRIASFTKKNHEELKEYVQEREVITTIKVLLTERRFRVSNRKQLRIKIKDTQELSNKKLAKRLIKDNQELY